MASVVTKNCVKCGQCVTICPVEAFHEEKNTVVINPGVCIDCGACISKCPYGIIYAEEDLPKNLLYLKQFNENKSKTFPVAKEESF